MDHFSVEHQWTVVCCIQRMAWLAAWLVPLADEKCCVKRSATRDENVRVDSLASHCHKVIQLCLKVELISSRATKTWSPHSCIAGDDAAAACRSTLRGNIVHWRALQQCWARSWCEAIIVKAIVGLLSCDLGPHSGLSRHNRRNSLSTKSHLVDPNTCWTIVVSQVACCPSMSNYGVSEAQRS